MTFTKIVSMVCDVDGCNAPRAINGKSKNGTKYYSSKCSKHYKQELVEKRGYSSFAEYENDLAKKKGFASSAQLRNSRHPSRQHRKEYCENIDGRLGFVCTTTILLEAQLHADHIDGNPSHHDASNIQTLCACCHTYKTLMNGDILTEGRKTLGVKY